MALNTVHIHMRRRCTRTRMFCVSFFFVMSSSRSFFVRGLGDVCGDAERTSFVRHITLLQTLYVVAKGTRFATLAHLFMRLLVLLLLLLLCSSHHQQRLSVFRRRRMLACRREQYKRASVHKCTAK